MDLSTQDKNHPRALKAIILEDRDIYRFFLRSWLEGKNGHQVRFVSSAEFLEADQEPREVELMAAHLLPGSVHFKRHSKAHAHAVYGDGLDPATIFWCRKNGVQGILELRDPLDDWNQCLENLANGTAAETPSVRRVFGHGHGKGLSRLSRRECEVARMLVKGFSAKQVSAALGTSEGTVKNQRKAVYRKLGIVRATQLAGAMGFKPR